MDHSSRFFALTAILIPLLLWPNIVRSQNKEQLVRLAVIQIHITQIDAYNEFLKEEIEASIRLEPGVITLYGIAEKENPNHIILFETYADSSEYIAHLATPHFQKYKQGTLQMVKHLELKGTEPILYLRKPQLEQVNNHNLLIHLTQIELKPKELSDFKRLMQNVLLPGIEKENGVLVMYAVSDKNNPNHVTILEVYTNRAAHKNHLNTLHFLQYKAASKNMVNALKIIEMKSVLLGSKEQ